MDLLFINLLIICVNLNCQQFGIWFNLYSFDLLSAFFSILLQIVKILSVFNQFYKLIVDSSLNNLLIISLNLYSCTGSRSPGLLDKIFLSISQCFYTKLQLFFHSQPIWITIFGIDEEYIKLFNSKYIFPSVFSCSSTPLLPNLLHHKYNSLHSISNFICYNLVEEYYFSKHLRHSSSNAIIQPTLSISNHQTRPITAHVHPTPPKAWSVTPSPHMAAALQGPTTAATALLMG